MSVRKESRDHGRVKIELSDAEIVRQWEWGPIVCESKIFPREPCISDNSSTIDETLSRPQGKSGFPWRPETLKPEEAWDDGGSSRAYRESFLVDSYYYYNVAYDWLTWFFVNKMKKLNAHFPLQNICAVLYKKTWAYPLNNWPSSITRVYSKRPRIKYDTEFVQTRRVRVITTYNNGQVITMLRGYAYAIRVRGIRVITL